MHLCFYYYHHQNQNQHYHIRHKLKVPSKKKKKKIHFGKQISLFELLIECPLITLHYGIVVTQCNIIADFN